MNGVRRATERLRRLGGVEGLDDDMAVDSPEERAVVLEQPIHHRLVRADENHEQRPPSEVLIPEGLEKPVEAGVRLIRPGELVDDEHGRPSITANRNRDSKSNQSPGATTIDRVEPRQRLGRRAECLDRPAHLHFGGRPLQPATTPYAVAAPLGEVFDEAGLADLAASANC